MAEKDFPFIVLNGPKVNDAGQRRVIRKQAMKDVGEARKRHGSYGRLNTRQIPLFEDDTTIRIRRTVRSRGSTDSSLTSDPSTGSTSDSSNSSESADCDEEVVRPKSLSGRKVPVAHMQEDDVFSLAAINLFSDYETVRAKFRIDIVDLSILTNFNVGKSTSHVISADPTRLADLLGEPQWSYMQFVPSLYGSSEVVTAAANCLMAKAKITLSPRDQCNKVTLQLYAKALSSLQKAIADESNCTEADVLCATQLMSLHELLDPTGSAAWSHHVRGSARLVKYRGPHRFDSELDKALFASHVGQIVSECLSTNLKCYLEEDEWSNLYKSLVQESTFLTDRSPLTIKIRLLLFPLPGLWHDIQEAIMGPDLFNDAILAPLEARTRKYHQAVLDWMEEYKMHCVRLSMVSPPPSELAMRRELFGASVECLSIFKRLLATLCDKERVRLEGEAQALAQLALDLQKQPSSKHSWLFSGHETSVANTLIISKEDWESDVEYPTEFGRRMAIRQRYSIWNSTLRSI